ncbi:nucleotide exchange factor GrpE [Dactylosporangium roseum]|uniref:Protein GrpE n=1 Tax=Dactylosporangium roseum TaxID=47989 RepID=A0ABY5Z3V7_9ACTN|nr:nucleotide exchange factor GrpE [Dactylosporangium roseum]UWZ36726.1 nucleotide exchange factor GrpE [Dactylosporangium roseum]
MTTKDDEPVDTAGSPAANAAPTTAEEADVEVETTKTDDPTAATAESPAGDVQADDAPVEGEIVDEPFTVHADEPSKVDGAAPHGAAAQGTTDDAHQHGLGAELAALRTELDERTRDLQRVTAEYANYRKRVDRDRALVVEQATGNVLGALLPVLDDLDRARDHGDLVGPFGAVADQLTTALTKFGLTVFGAKGDPFDPTRHEAVAHLTSAEVTEPTCVDVMRRGYLLGERLLRPAMVAVADPE